MADQNHLSNFNRGSPKKLYREIILKSGHWPTVTFKGFSIFSSGGPFVQQSRTILAVLIEGHPRNRSVKLFFEIGQLAWEKMSFKHFSIF